jgi:hypothetical protein
MSRERGRVEREEKWGTGRLEEREKDGYRRTWTGREERWTGREERKDGYNYISM